MQVLVINLLSRLGVSLIDQLVKNPLAMREIPVWLLGQKIHWRRDRLPTPVFWGFPCGSADKKYLPAMQETPVRFLGQESPWRRDRLPTPVFLGFPCGSAGKESARNAGDLGWEDTQEK